jgi:hypothetical protein
MGKRERQRNQNGEIPSDKPSKELISPSKEGEEYKSTNREVGRNTTAKDPNLGKRNAVR